MSRMSNFKPIEKDTLQTGKLCILMVAKLRGQSKRVLCKGLDPVDLLVKEGYGAIEWRKDGSGVVRDNMDHDIIYEAVLTDVTLKEVRNDVISQLLHASQLKDDPERAHNVGIKCLIALLEAHGGNDAVLELFKNLPTWE